MTHRGSLRAHLNLSLRMIRRSPLLSTVIILSLAIGIGANTAIFTLVHGILVRSLPYPDAERILAIRRRTVEGTDRGLPSTVFYRWRAHTQTFETLSAYIERELTLAGVGEPVHLNAAEVSAGFFETLGSPAVIGRTFDRRDERPDARLVVLGHSLWIEAFGAHPSVVGESVLLDGQAYTVIGVARPGMNFPSEAQCWVAMGFVGEGLHVSAVGSVRRAGFEPLSIVGLMRADATLDQVKAETSVVLNDPSAGPRSRGAVTPDVTSLVDLLVGPVRPHLIALQAAVVVLLLMVVANVAGLGLIRGIGRRREFGVRCCLGAPRGALVSQLLIESLMLSAAGAAAGLILASWVVEAVKRVNIAVLPRLSDVSIDGPVLGLTLVLSIASGLAAGVAPALYAFRLDPAAVLRGGGERGVLGVTAAACQRALAIAEVGGAVSLVAAAIALVSAFVALKQGDYGFDPRNVIVARLDLPTFKYLNIDDRVQTMQRLVDGFRQLPGVSSSALVNDLPLTGVTSQEHVLAEGQTLLPGAMPPLVPTRIAAADYFRVLGLRLLNGRAYGEYDTAAGAPVAVVSATYARRHFPDGQALHRYVLLHGQRREIVGVVADVKHENLNQREEAAVYYPLAQLGQIGDKRIPATFRLPRVYVVLQSRLEPEPLIRAMRARARELDAAFVLDDVQPMNGIVARSVGRLSFAGALMAGFAIIALATAAIGIYGTVSYLVSERVPEIGVRIALGAGPRNVLAAIGRSIVLIVLPGITVGLLLSSQAFVVLRMLVPDSGIRQAVALPAAAAVLIAVTSIASYGPVRRALRVNVSDALRSERPI